MPEFAAWCSPLKSAHVGLVLVSGGLFALRGVLVLAGQSGAMARPWRMLRYGIDTLLLAAGVTLWGLLSLNPVASPWLGTKLLMLYIVLGSLALKRAKPRAARRASCAGVLAVDMFMGSVALSHQPLGFFQPWWTHGA